jgi:hypothetical protein
MEENLEINNKRKINIMFRRNLLRKKEKEELLW